MTVLNGSWGYYSQSFLTVQFLFVVLVTIAVEFGVLFLYIGWTNSNNKEIKTLPIFLCVCLGNLLTAIAGIWILGGI